MRITFANESLRERCEVVAAMVPEQWHHRGTFNSAPIISGNTLEWLVDNGLLERRRLAFSEWLYEYRLTGFGVVTSAQLRSIGIPQEKTS